MSHISREELPVFVERTLTLLSKFLHDDRATVLLLEGDLGAGKTTFVQELANKLGVKESVQSPTFVLLKRYKTAQSPFTSLVHIDAYRFTSPKEFETLQPHTFLYEPHTLVCIEWPERLENVLPAYDMKIQFAHMDSENMREVSVEGEI